MKLRTRFITTAIEYPDGAPHLGHGYEKIIADAQARYHRLSGARVTLSLGLDEHSQKVAAAARAQGLAPRDYVDRLEPLYHKCWRSLGLGPYEFIRTSSERHRQIVQNWLQRAFDQGDIYRGEYAHQRCATCGPDIKPHVENGRCRLHQTPIKSVQEPSYYFRLSKYLPASGAPPERVDFALSRQSDWGIALPFAPDDPLARRSVAYVWFDALLSYLTVAGEHWPADLQVIGHDIARFHTSLWPAILSSIGLPPPRKLLVHGHLLKSNQVKLSKSNGDGSDSFTAALEFGSDALRYYLLKQFRIGADRVFDLALFRNTVRLDLSDKFTGLVRQTENWLVRDFGGKRPAGVSAAPQADFLDHLARYERAMDDDDPHTGALELFELMLSAKKFVGQKAHPDPAAAAATALENLRLVAVCAWPILPATAEEIFSRLGIAPPALAGTSCWSRQWRSDWKPGCVITSGREIFAPRSAF